MHILDYAELSLISSEPVGAHAVTSEKEEHKRRRYWKLSSNFHLKKTTSITLKTLILLHPLTFSTKLV